MFYENESFKEGVPGYKGALSFVLEASYSWRHV
jgi:hypothetical protein